MQRKSTETCQENLNDVYENAALFLLFKGLRHRILSYLTIDKILF